ncbi:hypothetical protein X732_04165 [Mesorhizobium sp. L2C066B000]|nr:hypothetical protein X732_04165 [Mesorhizobium sp. L2C066B000]
MRKSLGVYLAKAETFTRQMMDVSVTTISIMRSSIRARHRRCGWRSRGWIE